MKRRIALKICRIVHGDKVIGRCRPKRDMRFRLIDNLKWKYRTIQKARQIGSNSWRFRFDSRFPYIPDDEEWEESGLIMMSILAEAIGGEEAKEQFWEMVAESEK